MSLDQRKFRRVEGQVLVDIEPLGSVDTQEAQTLDISEGGLKVILNKAIDPDSRVMVSCTLPLGVSGEFFLEARAVVKWCNPIEDLFEVGIEFLEMTHDDQENLIDYMRRSSSGY